MRMDFHLRARGVIDKPVSMPLVGKHALVFHRRQTVGILAIIVSLRDICIPASDYVRIRLHVVVRGAIQTDNAENAP